MDQKPSVGRIVLYRDEQNRESPAIITKVWSDTTINLSAFVDGWGSAYPQSSVVQNESMTDGDQTRAWRWPPRV